VGAGEFGAYGQDKKRRQAALMQRFEAIGRLGTDPEVRTTPSGKQVARFRLAVSSKRASGPDNERRDDVLWLDASAWEPLAAICGQYLKKGDRLYAAGKLQIRQFTATDGSKRIAVEFTVAELEMLGGMNSATAGGDAGARAAEGSRGAV
jgi:single-strand DNA-binding protein